MLLLFLAFELNADAFDVFPKFVILKQTEICMPLIAARPDDGSRGTRIIRCSV